MKDAIVFYTAVGPSHLVPMVELAKHFLCSNFSVTIVVADLPFNPGLMAETVSRISSANPLISFHILPSPTIELDKYGNLDKAARFFASIRDNNAKLLEFLTCFAKTNFVRAFVLDFFCTASLEVAQQLLLPAYVFSTFGAFDLAIFLHATETSTDLVDFPAIAASDLPEMLDGSSDIYKVIMQTMPNLFQASGVLINTFESLEPKPVAALREALHVPSRKMPPVFCVGPLIREPERKEIEERHECLTWLDSQPKDSVIFLCFGGVGGFGPDQIKQIAIGLESSEQRFLWVVKAIEDPRNVYDSKRISDIDDVIKLLPEGFLDRTKGKGMIVISRVPQLQVLRHEAVGGFVTHCGWNSILEAVAAGVPMICWPLYAEQRLNKVLLVEEIKIAKVMEGYDEEIVNSEEVEAKVRWLMESQSQGRRMIGDRMALLKEKAAEALLVGEEAQGPSSKALMRFMADLRGTN